MSVIDGFLRMSVDDRERTVPVHDVIGVRTWLWGGQGHQNAVVLGRQGNVVLSLTGADWQPWGGDRCFRALAAALGVPIQRLAVPERDWKVSAAVPGGRRTAPSWLRLFTGAVAVLAFLALLGCGRGTRHVTDPAIISATASALLWLLLCLDIGALFLCLANGWPLPKGMLLLKPAPTVTTRMFRRRARLLRTDDDLIGVDSGGQVLRIPLVGPAAPTQCEERPDRLVLLSPIAEPMLELLLNEWVDPSSQGPGSAGPTSALKGLLPTSGKSTTSPTFVGGSPADAMLLAENRPSMRPGLVIGASALLVLHLVALVAATGSAVEAADADSLRDVAALGAGGSLVVVAVQVGPWAWQRRHAHGRRRFCRAALQAALLTFPLWAGLWTAFLLVLLTTAPLTWGRNLVTVQAGLGAISAAVLCVTLHRTREKVARPTTGMSMQWLTSVSAVGVYTGVVGLAVISAPLGKVMLMIGVVNLLLLTAVGWQRRCIRHAGSAPGDGS